MNSFVTLIRRELWEHTTLRGVPVALLVFVVLINLAMIFSHDISVTAAIPENDNQLSTSQTYIDYFAALDDTKQSLVVNGTMITIGMIINTILLIVMFFYLLDSLYGERKDQSILFWKSLPVSNKMTVLSKLSVAIFIVPVIIFITSVLADLITLAMQSYSLYLNEQPAAILWKRADLTGLWMLSIYHLIQQTIWYFPVMGWLLLCSAWSRKKPIIIAVLLPALLVFIDSSFLLGTGISEIILERLPLGIRSLQLGDESNLMAYNFDLAGQQPGFNMVTGITLPGTGNIVSFLLNYSVWSGIIAGTLFTGLAITLRRLRDDSL
jgi:ABC-2 type transport system permease protein